MSDRLSDYEYVVVPGPGDPDMTTHVHNNWTCPPHLDGCDCPDLAMWACNQYYSAGACPDDIDVMPQPIPSNVIVVPPELGSLRRSAAGVYEFFPPDQEGDEG